MGIHFRLISLLPKHLCFQIIRKSFQSHFILLTTDFHILLCLFQRTFGKLRFQPGLIQIIGSLHQLQQHLFIDIFLFKTSLFQLHFGRLYFIGTFAKMKQRNRDIQEYGKSTLFHQSFIIDFQSVKIIITTSDTDTRQ